MAKLKTENPSPPTSPSRPSRRAGYLDLRAITPPVNGPQGAQHAAIMGSTGTGKSFLAEQLLNQYGVSDKVPKEYRALKVILDPDDGFDYPGKVVHKPDDVILNERVPVIRYVPLQRYVDDGESWNRVLFNIYSSPFACVTYYDEFKVLKPLFPPRKVEGGNYLTAMLTRGRKRLKCSIMAMQSPSSVDLDAIRQARWFYAFDLPFEEDRMRLIGIIGRQGSGGEDLRDRKALEKYQFWFYGPPVQLPTRMRVIP